MKGFPHSSCSKYSVDWDEGESQYRLLGPDGKEIQAGRGKAKEYLVLLCAVVNAAYALGYKEGVKFGKEWRKR